jgi:hypothetical protein
MQVINSKSKTISVMDVASSQRPASSHYIHSASRQLQLHPVSVPPAPITSYFLDNIFSSCPICLPSCFQQNTTFYTCSGAALRADIHKSVYPVDLLHRPAFSAPLGSCRRFLFRTLKSGFNRTERQTSCTGCDVLPLSESAACS